MFLWLPVQKEAYRLFKACFLKKYKEWHRKEKNRTVKYKKTEKNARERQILCAPGRLRFLCGKERSNRTKKGGSAQGMKIRTA